ncbi:DUF6446 family protein [Amaricoccus sp. W119]|uniref:DUF6446 family protein n=1 Tax=Amaricoccus sp. W119 TaxID=3391833 RepID=UPI0039A6A307
MNGKRLVQGFLVFLAAFAALLIYTQFFAYYERRDGVESLMIAGTPVAVSGYRGISSSSSPLKPRACFALDPEAVAGLAPATDATPLTAPFWFRCFDAHQLTEDIVAGAATAYALTRDEPKGFDEMVAVYPDGRAYLWRQLNETFRDQ